MRSTIHLNPEQDPEELAAELIPGEAPLDEHYRRVFSVALRLTSGTVQDIYHVRGAVIGRLWEAKQAPIPKSTVSAILYMLALSGHRRAWAVRGVPESRTIVTTLGAGVVYDRLLGEVASDFHIDRARPDRLVDSIDWHGDKQFRLFGQTTGLFDRVEAYEPGGESA